MDHVHGALLRLWYGIVHFLKIMNAMQDVDSRAYRRENCDENEMLAACARGFSGKREAGLLRGLAIISSVLRWFELV